MKIRCSDELRDSACVFQTVMKPQFNHNLEFLCTKLTFGRFGWNIGVTKRCTGAGTC